MNIKLSFFYLSFSCWKIWLDKILDKKWRKKSNVFYHDIKSCLPFLHKKWGKFRVGKNYIARDETALVNISNKYKV